MGLRKWSKQGFLNPADSNDDGWFKFSIRPRIKDYRNSIGVGIQYIISDCSNKIYLEFEPENIAINADGSVYNPADAKRVLASIKVRRKKIRLFAEAVSLSAEKIEETLDEYEAMVLAAIEKHRELDRDQ
jgi:hypothetical protein